MKHPPEIMAKHKGVPIGTVLSAWQGTCAVKPSTHNPTDKTAADSPSWRFAALLDAPHRLAYFMAVLIKAALWGFIAPVLAVVGWSIRYGHWFGLPRLDGRPG